MHEVVFENGPKTLHTDHDEDDGVEQIHIADPSAANEEYATRVARMQSCEEEQLKSMLKDSKLDLDNSRNDVIPSKSTKLPVFASVHPEGEGYDQLVGGDSSDSHNFSRSNRSNMEDDGMGP